jgi:hypothetical protein
MAHLHSFNLWNASTRSYDCECGATLLEEVLEAHAPYGANIYRQRIHALQTTLLDLWMCANDAMVEGGLRRRVLEEIQYVATGFYRERIVEELRGDNGSENPHERENLNYRAIPGGRTPRANEYEDPNIERCSRCGGTSHDGTDHDL